MSWYDDRAGSLQAGVRSDESRQPNGLYDEDQERQAIIHARQDIVLMYSQLSSANGQLRTIKYLLAGILIALALPFFR